MLFRLLTGILAATFLPLGGAFVIVGLTVDQPDRGRPEAFLYAGIPIAAAGVACAIAFVVLWRREAGRRRRRRQGLRAAAEILRADVNWHVRVNGRPLVRLTLRLPGDATVSGSFAHGDGPMPAPGTRIDVLYDPADPSNFELVA